jgi:hypothetical protein
LFGYRRADVDIAIAERDNALVKRGEECSYWRRGFEERDEALAARDGALRAAQARIEELDKVGTHLSRRVVARERELEALRAQIDEVCAQARGYATRVRMQALRQAVSIAAGDANGNGGSGSEADERVAAAAEEHAAAAETAAAAPESTFGVRPAAPADRFEGVVQLEIGPLADFSQLVGFEDAAGAIEATSEISVTRFSAGRASLDLKLSEPVDLLRELGERAPFGFEVRSVRDGRLILDLADEAEAA